MPAPGPDSSPVTGAHTPSAPVARRERPRRPIQARGLLVPANSAAPCTLRDLTLTAVALSDAIGGGLLEEALHGEIGGARFCVYLDEDRASKRLPPNAKAAALCARLGQTDSAWMNGLLGDVLLLGCDVHLNDVDVPLRVVEAARACGLVVQWYPG